MAKRSFWGNKVLDEVKPESWEASDNEAKAVLRFFFSNVRYLLEVRGISLRRMQAEMKDRHGFKIGKNTVKNYIERDDFKDCRLSYLSFYALYLHEPLFRLLSIDYREQDLK